MNMSIDEEVELLYGGSSDEKLQGVNKLLAMCQQVSDLELMISNNQLMAALTRIFTEDSSIELSFAISKLLLAFASVEDFHELLSSYRIGALTLGVVELEVKRASHRGNDLSCIFTKKQEPLTMICCKILCYIADDFGALRKMVKKGLAMTLGKCCMLKTLPALDSVLSLMAKACIFEEAADELSSDESNAIERLVDLLHVNDLNSKVISVLFNLSFHDKCLSSVTASNIHFPLTKMLGKKSSSSSVYKLAYHLSCSQENREKFVQAAISKQIMDILTHLQPHETIAEGLAGLIVNMTLHPLCAEDMLKGGIVGAILGAIDESDEFTQQTFLKVMKNLSCWSRKLQSKLYSSLAEGETSQLDGLVRRAESYFPTSESETSIMYWEQHFWDQHVEAILERALRCKSFDLLAEWIGILSNITKDDLPAGLVWHDLLYDNSSKVLTLCHDALDSSHLELKVEVVIWLGEICSSQESSAWIASSNLIEAMNEELQDDAGSEAIRLQILLSYQQFMMYEETRFQVVGGHGEKLLFIFDDQNVVFSETNPRCRRC
jgi:hypothetical protein